MRERSESSLDHLFNEMRCLDQRLHLEVRKARERSPAVGDERFRGLYVSDAQIDTILEASAHFAAGASAATSRESDAGVVPGAGQEDVTRTPQREESGRRLAVFRLNELARLFGLSRFEMDTVLLCLLPDVELKYERLYAYLQDDITKKRPTVETVIRLQRPAGGNEISLRQAFHASAPLFRTRLLRFADDRLSSSVSLLARQLEIDERISAYLLGFDQVDARILHFVRVVRPKARLNDAIIPDDIRQRLAGLVRRTKDEEVVLRFRGNSGAGRQNTAEALCHELGVPLLVADADQLPEQSPLESLLPLVFREGRLQGAILYLECDRLMSAGMEAGPSSRILEREIEAYPGWVILSGDQEWQPSRLGRDKPFVSVDFPLPSYTLRQQAWQNQGKEFSFADDVDFADLAGRFRLSVGQIRDAIVVARNFALWRSPEDSTITLQDVHAACRRLSRPGLNALAHKIASNYVWHDIILPREQVEHLREICSFVKYHETVYGEWGFGRKHSRGKGLNVLFAGPSGTGKTMAAEIMAGELGFDLYKIDLSTIVSKYIGETEKNLDRIFREAQLSNAILFFDEADALFGKRSEVRDSHDRYANIEVAYLLQKMEDYDGVVILATNLRKNMDEAFARRMHFTVEFPMPEEEDRLRIWRGVFPGEAPLSKDTDLNFMARQFKISGGNIKNIALNAAFLAAQDGKVITIEHLIRATKREYQKIGKLCTEGDFAQYYEAIKG